MVELVDAADSKSAGGNPVRVQVPPSAIIKKPLKKRGNFIIKKEKSISEVGRGCYGFYGAGYV